MGYHSYLRIFIIEGDPLQQHLLKRIVDAHPSFKAYQFSSRKACLDNLDLSPHVILLDYDLPDISTPSIIPTIRAVLPQVKIIALSKQNNIDTAFRLCKEGADDYITKNHDFEARLSKALSMFKEQLESRTVPAKSSNRIVDLDAIIGESNTMQQALKLIQRATQSSIVVSITGETGTGKEIIARSIHYQSDRRNKRFVAVNVAAIPRDLVESELFGYEKGAFTGASARKIGKFEFANGGTLFLDEIGDLDINLQTKLLRVLQEQELTRVGGNQSIKLDVRIITATHKDLTIEVDQGRFREDLYYRLLGLSIELPPLRERGNDILLLAEHFLKKYSEDHGLSLKKLSPETEELLLNYNFPGNVRELRSIIELAIILCDQTIIQKEHIKFRRRQQPSNLLEQEMTIRDYTKRIIQHYLQKYNNDVTLVSQKLAIGRSTIYKLLKEDRS